MATQNIFINGKYLTQKITGVQRFADELTVRLIKQFENYMLIVPSKLKLDTFRYPENKIIRLRSIKDINMWEQIILPRFLKKNSNPILLCMSGLGPVFYKNKIITIHDLSFWEHPEWFSKKYYLFYRLLTPLTVSNCLHLFTVSNYSKKVIQEKLKIKEKNISIIYNAVNECNCRINKTAKSNSILVVGSIDPRKNIKRLIQAFIKWNNSTYKLIIVGGLQKSFAKEDFEQYPNIHFTGYITEKELHHYYSSAKIFIYPSLYEGFGIPPLEAMKHGLPVIASNVTSLPEVCGDAAIYVDPHSEFSIINALDKITGNEILQNEMITKGFENLKRYSWDKSVYKINNILTHKINL